MLINLSDPPVS